jgi:hypothetical protein
MPEEWKIQQSRAEQVSDTPCWVVTLLKADGNTHDVLMPTVALEWRAAEYGIDPADVDTLLDVILHEPHIPMVDDGSGLRYADNGPDLLSADSTDDARAAHLARIKASPVRINVQGAKALDTIRNGHRPDAARIRAMREAVDTNRWVKKHGGLPLPPLPQTPLPQTPIGKKEAARA